MSHVLPQVVCEGDVSAVVSLLDKAQEEVEAAKAQLCHPLCNCEKCTALENRYCCNNTPVQYMNKYVSFFSQLDDADKVTVYSRDGDGRTGLHHAARMGGLQCSGIGPSSWPIYILLVQ